MPIVPLRMMACPARAFFPSRRIASRRRVLEDHLVLPTMTHAGTARIPSSAGCSWPTATTGEHRRYGQRVAPTSLTPRGREMVAAEQTCSATASRRERLSSQRRPTAPRSSRARRRVCGRAQSARAPRARRARRNGQVRRSCSRSADWPPGPRSPVPVEYIGPRRALRAACARRAASRARLRAVHASGPAWTKTTVVAAGGGERRMARARPAPALGPGGELHDVTAGCRRGRETRTWAARRASA